jgi:hypothetical protein
MAKHNRKPESNHNGGMQPQGEKRPQWRKATAMTERDLNGGTGQHLYQRGL